MANDLQTTDRTSLSTQWSEPELPERLASLVSTALPDRLPALSELEAAAAAGALRIYGDYPRGTPPRLINRMMTRLALAYPNMKISEDEATARLELYADMLADIDQDILSGGFRAAVQTCKFFPSVSELRELALSQPASPRMVHQRRLRDIVELHEARKSEAPIELVTPEQRAAIKAEFGLADGGLVDRLIGRAA